MPTPSLRLADKSIRMASGGLAWGATNSGKSFGNASHFGRYMAMQPRRGILLGSNLRLMRGEIIPLIRSIARNYGVQSKPYNTDTGTFTVGPSTVYVIAAANVGDEERIRSYHNIDALMVEEVTKVPEVCYDMAVSRRQTVDAPVWASCNPSHPLNWVKKRLDAGRWLADEMFLLDDNPTMTPEERVAFADQFTGTFRKRMIDALWAAPEGLVYPAWDDVPLPDPPPNTPCYIGVDYGASNITAVVYAQLVERRFVITREYYYDGYAQGRRSPEEHAAAIAIAAPGPIAAGWIDPSARDLRLAMEKVGIPISMGFNKPSGYETTDGMLQRSKMQICAVLCPGLTGEILSLVYNRFGERPDASCVDHATDALRYLCCGLWEGMGATIDSMVLR